MDLDYKTTTYVNINVSSSLRGLTHPTSAKIPQQLVNWVKSMRISIDLTSSIIIREISHSSLSNAQESSDIAS
jgi:hypothetical protein